MSYRCQFNRLETLMTTLTSLKRGPPSLAWFQDNFIGPIAPRKNQNFLSFPALGKELLQSCHGFDTEEAIPKQASLSTKRTLWLACTWETGGPTSGSLWAGMSSTALAGELKWPWCGAEFSHLFPSTITISPALKVLFSQYERGPLM